MLLRHKILDQLHAKRDRFAAFDDDFQGEAGSYRDALGRLAELSGDELQSRLTAYSTPGALPTAEFDTAPNLRVGFSPKWGNHEEARAWAHRTLLGHITFAADGSQIQPIRDFSVPVAAIQVAWFINHHAPAGSYVKDIEFEVLAPDELQIEYNGELTISEQEVNLRRFEKEITTLCKLMRQMADSDELMRQKPLALFDSSLVISFADRLQEPQRSQYILLVVTLLRCSEETGVPLVGYVDTSVAHDLTNMLAHAFGLREAAKIHDAQLVNELLAWGERTPLFVCARGSADKKQQGVLDDFAEYRRGVGFVYLKTNSIAPPARLDIPLWIYECGLLEEVLDLVRAEVIVGNGYPYVIETADAAAVITGKDREALYAIFQKFAEEQGVELRISQKAASKARRR
ncbi:MAG TPA: DNA double-strand break repair nuclease NurA [Blastocatellia bacterium]|nr:DNA double-strand break repair nuclease NurA [Blastocatellia bacterium]